LPVTAPPSPNALETTYLLGEVVDVNRGYLMWNVAFLRLNANFFPMEPFTLPALAALSAMPWKKNSNL
jgi:hypothetical protein